MTELTGLLNVPQKDIYEYIESYAKIYPDLTKVFIYKEPIKSRIAGFEQQGKLSPKPRGTVMSEQLLEDSLRRTKTRLSDIVIANKFDMFCTFTFAEDRQNVELCKHKMEMWLKYENRFGNKFNYLIVPEFHKDGQSLHFHALFKGYKGQIIDSGHKRPDGRPVYNIPSYKYGFSTATLIDTEGIPKVSSYIKKYITKEMPHFTNKQRYWCSKGLIRPEKIKNPVLFPYITKEFDQTYQADKYTLHIANRKLSLISKI